MNKNILTSTIETLYEQKRNIDTLPISIEYDSVIRQFRRMKSNCTNKYTRHIIQSFENTYRVAHAIYNICDTIEEDYGGCVIFNTSTVIYEECLRLQSSENMKYAQEYLKSEEDMEFIIMETVFNIYPFIREEYISLYITNKLEIEVLKTGHINYDKHATSHKPASECVTCDGIKCDFCRIRVRYRITSDLPISGNMIYYDNTLDFCNPLSIFLFGEVLKFSETIPHIVFTIGQIKQFYSHFTKLQSLYYNAMMMYRIGSRSKIFNVDQKNNIDISY